MPDPLASFYLRSAAPPPKAIGCPACAHANPDGSRFCNACGARLDMRRCPLCEAVNDRTTTTCHKCGTLLSARHTTDGSSTTVDDLAGPTWPTQDLFPNLAHLRECPHCEALNDATASLCYRCEAPLVDIAAAPALHATEPPARQGDTGVPGAAPTATISPAADPPDFGDDAPAWYGIADAAVPGPLDTAPSMGRVRRTPHLPAVPNALLEDETRLHYVGTLTAPLDEAELARADLGGPPVHRRGAWILAGMLALIVLPAAVAGTLYAYGDPVVLDRAVSLARATLGSVLSASPASDDAGPPRGGIDAGASAPAAAPASPDTSPSSSLSPDTESAPATPPGDPSATAASPRLASLRMSPPVVHVPAGAKPAPRKQVAHEGAARWQAQSRGVASVRSGRGAPNTNTARRSRRTLAPTNVDAQAAKSCTGSAGIASASSADSRQSHPHQERRGPCSYASGLSLRTAGAM